MIQIFHCKFFFSLSGIVWIAFISLHFALLGKCINITRIAQECKMPLKLIQLAETWGTDLWQIQRCCGDIFSRGIWYYVINECLLFRQWMHTTPLATSDTQNTTLKSIETNTSPKTRSENFTLIVWLCPLVFHHMSNNLMPSMMILLDLTAP